MHKYTHNKLYVGEQLMLLQGPLHSYTHEQMPWFTKDKVLHILQEKWDFSSFHIKVSKILWDNSESDWSRFDDVECEKVAFDMEKLKDLDDLVGYLFQASIEGYTIRYASMDTLTGIYLQKTKDYSTNIDDEVLTTLVDVVHQLVKDRKPRWR